jgi:hypothetical protein
MKILNQTPKTRAVIIGAMALLCLLQFSSCLKDNNNNNVQIPTALLMVVQASPDAPAEALFLDNNRVNNPPLNYNDYVGYFNAYTGVRNAVLNNYTTAARIASDTIRLKANNAYSLFLSNTAATPDFTLFTDSLAQPASGMATVRLVNVSPDAGKIDLFANSTAVVNNEAYKGASSFKPVTGNTTYVFEIRKAGTNTVLTKDTANLKTGSVYTIWLHGLASGSGSTKLSAGILKNAYY